MFADDEFNLISFIGKNDTFIVSFQVYYCFGSPFIVFQLPTTFCIRIVIVLQTKTLFYLMYGLDFSPNFIFILTSGLTTKTKPK